MEVADFYYIIHLMWIQKAINNENKYIFPERAPHYYHVKLETIDIIKKWAELNYGRDIYFWYDGKVVSDEQLKNTKNVFNEINNVSFHEIHKLKKVQENNDVFKDPIPLYFKIDLLRAICVEYSESTKKQKYAIYSDLSIVPLDCNNLFDDDTINKLNKFGFIMSKNKNPSLSEPFENGFFIIDLENENIKKAHTMAIIDINIERANYALANNGWKNKFTKKDIHYKNLEEVIYESYYQLIKLYFVLLNEILIPYSIKDCKFFKLDRYANEMYTDACESMSKEEIKLKSYSFFFSIDHPYFNMKTLQKSTLKIRVPELIGAKLIYITDHTGYVKKEKKIRKNIDVNVFEIVDIQQGIKLMNFIKDVKQPKSRHYKS